jgi:hypothetical protein
VVTGCNGGEKNLLPLAPSPTLRTVNVSIAAAGMNRGLASTWQFQATTMAQLSDGSAQDVTAQATWTSSNPAVAIISATGLITAQGEGVTAISATYQGVVGTVVLGIGVEI